MHVTCDKLHNTASWRNWCTYIFLLLFISCKLDSNNWTSELYLVTQFWLRLFCILWLQQYCCFDVLASWHFFYIVFADFGRQQIRRCSYSILPTATPSTKIKRCLLMTAVFSVHTADRYGAYKHLRILLQGAHWFTRQVACCTYAVDSGRIVHFR